MPSRRLRLPAVTLLAALCVLLAACGGDGARDTEETPPATTTAGVTEQPAAPTQAESGTTRTATPAVTTEAGSESTPTSTPEETAAAREVPSVTASPRAPAIGGLAGEIEFPDFQSYRYSLRIDLQVENASLDVSREGASVAESLLEAGAVVVDGAYVAPDRYDIRVAFGQELAVRAIEIGPDSWLQLGEEGLWLGPSDELGQLNGFTPEEFFAQGFLSRDDLEGLPFETETLDGIVTHHYQVTPDEFEALKSLLGDDEAAASIETASIDVWLAEEGDWPVKMEITGRGVDPELGAFDIHLLFELFDVNEPIVIEPPS